MNISRASLALAIVSLAFPLAASAASVSISNLSPGTTVPNANNLSFTATASGISYPSYSVSDSFSNSSITANNINPGGNFSWTPGASDAGTHTITVTAQGSEGSASASQTITVLPRPSISIDALSPGTSVLPGSTLSFTVNTVGFTNPTFTVGGTGNPTIQPSNIDASGRFSWTPVISDTGEHTISVYVSDATGHSASKSVTVRVGAGPSLSIILLNPGASVKPGQLVTFAAAPNQYQPTGFSVADSFAGSTANSNNMNLSGQFSWTPSASDIGVHTLTILGVVGAYGASASTTQTITVLNADGSAPAGVAPAAPAGTAATTVAASSAPDTTLAALQAKLAALQGAIASAQSGTGSAAGQFTSYLKPGSNGAEVLALQKVLATLGYLTVAPNGNFGPATTAAVKAFQKAHSIEQLGSVGPSTRAALNGLNASASVVVPASSAQGSSSGRYVFEHFMGVGDDDAQDVSELQKRLSSLGYFSGAATGYFGAETEAAVKKFQAANGIPETGYVASITRAALNR